MCIPLRTDESPTNNFALDLSAGIGERTPNSLKDRVCVQNVRASKEDASLVDNQVMQVYADSGMSKVFVNSQFCTERN
jgi:hypothetical protein